MSSDFLVTINGRQQHWSENQVQQKLDNLGTLVVSQSLVRVSSDLSASRISKVFDKIWRVMVFCLPKLAEVSHRRLEKANETLEAIGKQIEAHPTLQKSFTDAQSALNNIALRNLSVDRSFKKVVSKLKKTELTEFRTINDLFRLKALKIRMNDGTSRSLLRVVQSIPKKKRDNEAIKNVTELFRRYSPPGVIQRSLSFSKYSKLIYFILSELFKSHKNDEIGQDLVPSLLSCIEQSKDKAESLSRSVGVLRDFEYLIGKMKDFNCSIKTAFEFFNLLPKEKRDFASLKEILEIKELCASRSEGLRYSDDNDYEEMKYYLEAFVLIMQKLESESAFQCVKEALEKEFGIITEIEKSDKDDNIVDSTDDEEDYSIDSSDDEADYSIDSSDDEDEDEYEVKTVKKAFLAIPEEKRDPKAFKDIIEAITKINWEDWDIKDLSDIVDSFELLPDDERTVESFKEKVAKLYDA